MFFSFVNKHEQCLSVIGSLDTLFEHVSNKVLLKHNFQLPGPACTRKMHEGFQDRIYIRISLSSALGFEWSFRPL